MSLNNISPSFTIPAFKTVVFRADSISLNTQESDTKVGTAGKGGTKPMVTFDGVESGNLANFILRSTDGTHHFHLTCPNKTTVYYSDKRYKNRSYDILPGTYDITSPIGVSSEIGVNLFSYSAETYFSNTKPNPISESGGSDGTTVTGGYYTND
jgi:hypothetical protein